MRLRAQILVVITHVCKRTFTLIHSPPDGPIQRLLRFSACAQKTNRNWYRTQWTPSGQRETRPANSGPNLTLIMLWFFSITMKTLSTLEFKGQLCYAIRKIVIYNFIVILPRKGWWDHPSSFMQTIVNTLCYCVEASCKCFICIISFSPYSKFWVSPLYCPILWTKKTETGRYAASSHRQKSSSNRSVWHRSPVFCHIIG